MHQRDFQNVSPKVSLESEDFQKLLVKTTTPYTWLSLSYTNLLWLCPTSLQDYQPHTISSPPSSLKCLSCPPLLLPSYKQLLCSDLLKDPVLGRKSVLSLVQVMKANTHSWMETLISCPEPLDFNWSDCECSNPGSFDEIMGKFLFHEGEKPQKCPLLSRGTGQATLQHWHHYQNMTSEHILAPAVFSQLSQLAFCPTVLCAGCRGLCISSTTHRN